MGKRSLCECKGCGKKIIFMITANGRMIPVDWKPELEDVDQFDEKKMVSHFATCPKSGDFRKKKVRKE